MGPYEMVLIFTEGKLKGGKPENLTNKQLLTCEAESENGTQVSHWLEASAHTATPPMLP
jgi:hypothetical protein